MKTIGFSDSISREEEHKEVPPVPAPQTPLHSTKLTIADFLLPLAFIVGVLGFGFATYCAGEERGKAKHIQLITDAGYTYTEFTVYCNESVTNRIEIVRNSK